MQRFPFNAGRRNRTTVNMSVFFASSMYISIDFPHSNVSDSPTKKWTMKISKVLSIVLFFHFLHLYPDEAFLHPHRDRFKSLVIVAPNCLLSQRIGAEQPHHLPTESLWMSFNCFHSIILLPWSNFHWRWRQRRQGQETMSSERTDLGSQWQWIWA